MQEECKAPVIMLILRGFSLYNQRKTPTKGEIIPDKEELVVDKEKKVFSLKLEEDKILP